jgi:hypothetical protein
MWGTPYGFPAPRAPGQQHQDARLSRRGRNIYLTILSVLIGGFAVVVIVALIAD